jgi:cobaltochelatase CobN
LQYVFQANAIVHLGKPGTLEWLPGKSIGLSAACYPDLALGDLPLIYPFIINDPGEGTQAKRRVHAVIIDHLIPAMMRADVYDDIAQLEQLLDEYYQVQTLDPSKLPAIQAQIWHLIVQADLHRDLHATAMPNDFNDFLLHVDGYLCELKDSQIRDGLHTLGQPPAGAQHISLVLAMLRLDNGTVRSLHGSLDFGSQPNFDRLSGYSGPTTGTRGITNKLQVRPDDRTISDTSSRHDGQLQ